MVTDNQKDCGNHFAIYTNVESCCIPETNRMLQVNCTSKNKILIEEEELHQIQYQREL